VFWFASTGAAGALLAAEDAVTTGPDFPRVPQFHPLPGRVVGVLVSDARRVLASEGRSGPPDGLCFSSGGGSYRWVYLQVPGKPAIGSLTLPVGEKGEALEKFDRLSMASRATVKPLGVTAPYTLVRVEVNGGRGSPATDRFVATQLEVLEGTDQYPIHVAAEIESLKSRAHTLLAEERHRSDLEAGMARAEAQALKGRTPAGPRETTEDLYVTWELRPPERLLVEFRIRVSAGIFRSGRGTDVVPPGQPGAAPQPPPLDPATRYGTLFGVETTVVFEVNPATHGVSERVLPVRTFVQELPPPQGSGAVPLPVLPPR
jgi:hypothetical protein